MDRLLIEDTPRPPENEALLSAWNTASVDLRKVLYMFGDSVLISDATGRILLSNPAARALIGGADDAAMPTFIQELLDKGMYDRSTALEAARLGKQVTAYVMAGGTRNSISTSTPVYDREGKLEFVVTNAKMWERLDKLSRLNLESEREQKDLYRSVANYLGQISHSGHRLVAYSPVMREVLSMVETVAPTEATVLLTGESGTGKDLLAQQIHALSSRSTEPFIPVNCAAIPHELMESEFFGYVKGAFTGAHTQGKLGLFEIAHGGTLFLDEIGELPMNLQSKLLRALEIGEIQRVGDTRRRKVNVRVLAATNRNLREMIPQNRFREDLFYRLNVIPIAIPPLRKRREDIVGLAEVFLADYCLKQSVAKIFSPGALRLLIEHNWPGNIRELRNIVERLAIVSRGTLIDEHMCSSFLRADIVPKAEAYTPTETLRSYRSRMEKAYLEKVLEACQGNAIKAADCLGIHKTALYRKLDAHGLR